MPATLDPIGGGLRLTIPVPASPEDQAILAGIRVWVDTASLGVGNPSDTYLSFHGDAFTVALSDLPIQPHFVKWAYISSIDPTTFEADETELMATPKPIGGTQIADLLIGKGVADRGSAVSVVVDKPATIETTTSVTIDDASYFPSGATAVVLISKRFSTPKLCRYTGKAGDVLTGFSGLQNSILVDDIMVPLPFASGFATSFVSGVLDIGSDNYSFPKAGGNGLSFGPNGNVDAFTFTGSTGNSLTGVSGLTAFDVPYSVRRHILHNPGFRTCSPAVGLTSTLTLSSAPNPTLYPLDGGSLVLPTSVEGMLVLPYDSIVGTTVNLSVPHDFQVAGTFYVIPDFSFVTIGASSALVAVSFRGVNFISNTRSQFENGYFDSDVGVGGSLNAESLTSEGIAFLSGGVEINGPVTSFNPVVAPNITGSDLPFKPNINRRLVNSPFTTTLTTVAGAANRMDIAPWHCPVDMTVDEVSVLCSTLIAASSVKIVIYAALADGKPGAKLFESEALATATVGHKTAATSLSFTAGTVYWIGVRHSSTATLNAHQPYCSPVLSFPDTPTTAAPKVLRRALAFATAAPATWGAIGAGEETAGNVAAVWLRVAA